MTALIITRYFHLFFILGVVGCLVTQNFVVSSRINRKDLSILSKADLVYGVCSILVVALGLTLWFGVGKPAEFYTYNWIFHTKVGLFVIVGLLSIYPTIAFNKWKKKSELTEFEVPKVMILVIRLELLLIALIPLLATIMARGIGSIR
jgi:putative membrane protein